WKRDAKVGAQMRLELKELRLRVPTTSIFVTHDQTEAMTLGDRIVVMKDGVVQQVGTSLELRRKPVNRFVASFIGSPSMNFLAVKVAAGGQHFTLAGQGWQVPPPSKPVPRPPSPLRPSACVAGGPAP